MKRALAILAGILFALPAVASTRVPREFDLGFIASRHVDLHGVTRTKALGPILEWSGNTNDMELKAVRPLYARVADDKKDKANRYVAWPLYASSTMRTESQWRFLVWYGFDHDYQKKDNRYRFWLFPFYYQGRDKDGAKYRAVFPFGGSIHEVLGRDEIGFALFPFCTWSRLNDLHTTSWLWPLISRTTSDHIHRFRVFPIYGRSKTDGKFEKKFIMWPIWNSVKYLEPGYEGGGFILFPVCGYLNQPKQKTVWIVPPFFRFTKGEKMDKVYCPWPFFQWSRGEIDKLYLWPLWGHKRIENLHSTFVLWPIFWYERFDKTTTTRYRFNIVPFYSAQTTVSNALDTASNRVVISKYRKVWPLFSYRRQGDESLFRVLALSPFVESPPVEYNWAPLWTLYSRNTKGNDRDVEFLWGLYRSRKRGPEHFESSLFPIYDWERDSGPERRRSWSLLKGLVGYEREGSRGTFRLLYFLRFGGKGASP